MVRISSMYAFQRSLDAMNDRRTSLLDVQEQMATGKRLNSPSDDPVNAATTINNFLPLASVDAVDDLTVTLTFKQGSVAWFIPFSGTNNGFIHPMHIHGGPFEVVARDGETIPTSARFLADTVNVGPGQRYDVIWTARKPGKWLIHCHIPHHTTNNNVEEKGGGGLMVVIDVS